MGEAGGCQAARGLCSGRNTGPRAVCRGFGPCMVRTPPGPCAGARPRPARPSGAIALLIRHSICRPAQGLRRGAVVRPEPAAGRAVWGSTPGGAEALTALAFSPKFCYPPWKDWVQRGGGTGWSSCGSQTLPAGPISYLLTRKRVKNLNLRVRNGQVSLSMPLGCPAEEADAMVRAKCRWIIQALERQWAPGPELPPEPARRECLRLLG